jgi:hypothetical protein
VCVCVCVCVCLGECVCVEGGGGGECGGRTPALQALGVCQRTLLASALPCC